MCIRDSHCGFAMLGVGGVWRAGGADFQFKLLSSAFAHQQVVFALDKAGNADVYKRQSGNYSYRGKRAVRLATRAAMSSFLPSKSKICLLYTSPQAWLENRVFESSHQNNRRACTSADWKSPSTLHRFQGYASDWKWNCFCLAARPHGIVLGKGR